VSTRRPHSNERIRTSLHTSRCLDHPNPALLQAIREFNQGLFFEQHETLEDAWIEESDDIRYLYQGILQVGVAFHHLNRGNFVGATRLMQRGMDLLRSFAPLCMGVDVERLLRDTHAAYRALLVCGPARLSDFDRSLVPAVHLAAGTAGEEAVGG
jgi:predicted metal-dependent hydrolase